MKRTRRASLVLLALFSGMLLTSRPLPAADAARDMNASARPIVLKAAHLFDSVSGKLIDGGVVIISGQTIQAVGSGLAIPGEEIGRAHV